MTRPWEGRLSLMPGAALFRGNGGDAAGHVHYAIQIVIALDGEVEVVTDRGTTCGPIALVPSGVRHTLDAEPAPVLLALVEPLGPRGRDLSAHLDAADALALREAAAGSWDEGDPAVALDAVLSALGVTPRCAPTERSDSLERALAAIDVSGGDVSLADAAAAAHLSPSRFSHVFSDEVGITFARYRLWVRLARAAGAVADGASLTRAAADAGFSDSAHFSRTFSRTIGLPPSALLAMTLDAA